MRAVDASGRKEADHATNAGNDEKREVGPSGMCMDGRAGQIEAHGRDEDDSAMDAARIIDCLLHALDGTKKGASPASAFE